MKKLTLSLLLAWTIAGYAQQNEITFLNQNINFSAAPRSTINPMSIKMWNNYNNGGPSGHGTVLEFYGLNGHQTGQLYFGGWDNSRIRYREAFYDENNWSNWVTLLDSKNNLESSGNLMLTGTGNHIINGGNVGIGISNPSAKLHVNGNQILNGNLIFESDQTAYFIKGPGNGGAIRIRSNVGNDTDRNVQFGNVDNNGTWHSYMTVASGGNVGIGSTTPQEKLSVNGKIRAHEVKVETTNWPDYVFEEDYQLKTLGEIEKFIKTNKHLPEVPSAKEVEKNGVELGEMNKILLKKIEEFTLLLIELKKENINMNERLRLLEKTKN